MPLRSKSSVFDGYLHSSGEILQNSDWTRVKMIMKQGKFGTNNKFRIKGYVFIVKSVMI